MKRHFLIGVFAFSIIGLCAAEARSASDSDYQTAKQLLLEAVELGAKLEPPGEQIDLYKTIAEEFAAMGSASEAIRLADSFDVGRGKDDVLLSAVRGSLRIKRLDEAMKIGNLISGEYERGVALVTIARKQAEERDFVHAMETWSTIKFVPLADLALSAIVKSMVKAGFLDKALRAALNLDDSDSKGQVISSIVQTQFRLGDKKGARETATNYAKEIEDEWPLLTLAEEEANAGDFPEAHRIAAGLKEQLRFFALGDIAKALAEHGEIPKALALAMSIPSPINRYEDPPTTHFRAVGAVAIAQAERGDDKGALSTARLIPPKIRACDICGGYGDEVISDIGKVQARRGDFALAFTISQELKKTGYYGDEVIKEVALTQMKRGEIEASLKTLKRSGYRAYAYMHVVQRWVRRDGRAPAMRWASQLKSKLEKAYALVGITRAVMDQDQPTDFSWSHPLEN